MNSTLNSTNGINVNQIAQDLTAYYLQPIQHLLKDPVVKSIALNDWKTVFVRRGQHWEPTDIRFASPEVFDTTLKTLVNQVGGNLDPITAPIADARLPDGSRINVVLSSVSPRGSNLTIRLFPKVRFTLEDLIERGALNDEMRDFLNLSVLVEDNQLVSGATGSGKTTILNALGNLTPDNVRLGVFEDTAELNFERSNILYMEAQKKSGDSARVTLETIVVNALRQEFGALVVGEIRDPTAATALMLALNTGHRAVKSTLHANNDQAALRRLINMLLANDTRMPYDAVRTEILENFDLIIQTEHTPRDGQRIVQISEICPENGVQRLYVWDYLERTHKRVWKRDKPPKTLLRARNYGLPIPTNLQ